MFSSEYCEISNNTCLEEHQRTAVKKKDFLEISPVTMIIA